VWTTSRPLATTLPFDPHTTGAMLFGDVFSRSGTLGYQAYGQFTDQFDRVATPERAARSGGGRLDYAVGDAWAIGGSYLAFTPPGSRAWRHVMGLDGVWRRDRFELMGEFAHVQPTSGPGRQWGLYLQAVEQVLPRTYLVQRYEHEDQPGDRREVNLLVLGVAYKPWPSVVLKGEYLLADHRAEESPPGIKASIAVLF
jgi:hypothetical protein